MANDHDKTKQHKTTQQPDNNKTTTRQDNNKTTTRQDNNKTTQQHNQTKSHTLVDVELVTVSRYICDTGANVGAPGRRNFLVKWRTNGIYPHTLGKGKRGKLFFFNHSSIFT